jgi:hypothetical protein
LSGYSAGYAYRLGLLNRDMDFTELRQESLIVRPPGAKPDAEYSEEIRRGLPLVEKKKAVLF